MNARVSHGLALVLGGLLTFAAVRAAMAEEADPKELMTPASTIRFGPGYLTDDARRFGEYTGLREKGWYGLFDFDIRRRNDATGEWLDFRGRNVGLDSRELGFSYQLQGDARYFLEFSQTPRFEPLLVNTALLGIDTNTQTVNRAPTYDVDLNTQRRAFTAGFDKILPANLDLQVRFRNEEKTGSRIYSQGFFGTINFLAEPVDYTTRQVEATLAYTSERLQVSGGYYGLDFSNSTPWLNVIGGIAGLSPMSLPPGNQSHQFNLTGGYSFTPTTRATLKAAWTHQTQNDAFNVPSLTGRANLGGSVDTTLIHAAITSRPLPKLTLSASARYEDRDDRTPVDQYLNAGLTPTSTFNGLNLPYSNRTFTAKTEASYALPAGVRLIGGLDYEERSRNTHDVRTVGFREQTDEWSARAELRRSLSETITGSVSYVHADRTGSDFQTTVLNNGTVGSNLVHPLELADRRRDKVRFTLNWQPLEPLSVQVYADYAHDRYSGRMLGPREGEAQVYSLDVGYALSAKWQASVFASRTVTKAEQSTCAMATTQGVCVATAALPLWDAKLRNTGDSLGLTLRGKPLRQLEVGADAVYTRNRSDYLLSTTTPNAVVDSLPSTYFDEQRLAAFARYEFQKNAGVQMNYIYDRWKTNDWTWESWVYSDGTRVLQEPVTNAHFVGVTLYYRWQ